MKAKLAFAALAVSTALLTGCNDDKKTENAVVAETTDSVAQVEVTDNLVEAPVQLPADTASFIPVEGTHYEVLEQSLDVDLNDQLVISEFFWLGCPHCQTFEPAVQGWKQMLKADGENVRVDKTAVPGNDRWNYDSAVYFTMKEMGATDEQVTQMLALYEEEGKVHKTYPTPERVKTFFTKLGFDAEVAMATISNTEFLNPTLQKANTEYNKTESGGVPVFVINGKYKILFGGMESEKEILDTMKYINTLK